MRRPVKEEVEVIVKPRTDTRQYRRIVLSNSLQALLISDPDTDKCAASMDVNVGYFSDPVGLEGLAHFLEHMLFYASEKYPLEGSYKKYILEHGGRPNAYTTCEHTNYYFDVNSDFFEEALDRFAQFFIAPLLSEDATMREIKAVDSEYQKNLLLDSRRMDQLQKHLTEEGHPYHKFSTGNWKTLEVRPKEKGVDTRLELIKFYKENYSANIMLLVIYSKDSLNRIQNMVEQKFQKIPNNNRTFSVFDGQPCTLENLQILVRAVPVENGHTLRIKWPVFPGIFHYKKGPYRYLSYLLNHKGEGSLFCCLKTLGWATNLISGEYNTSEELSFFRVIIKLTNAGHEHMQNILGLLFKYIHILQKSGACKWIFEELSGICETRFHYKDKTSPLHYVTGISSNAKMHPPQDWLIRSSMPLEFDPEIIQMAMDQLSPNNLQIFWDLKKFEGETNMIEPWYGTRYSIEKITGSTIQTWMLSSPNENLRIPAPNEFIPTNFSLKESNDEVNIPVLLRKSSCSTLWYKPDTKFSMPKAYVKIEFNCPHASISPETKVLTKLFTWMVTDYLNEYAYYASIAGLSYGISDSDSGFQVTLFGYNHKLRNLLENVIEKIAKFEVKPDRFALKKEKLTKDLENLKFQQPHQQARYYCKLILKDHVWPWMEQLEVLSSLETEDLAKFVPVMLSSTFLECYIAGNIDCSESESIVQYLEDIFFEGPDPPCRSPFPSQHLTNRVVQLEKGTNHFYTIKGLNPKDENSALLHYIQVHQGDYMLNAKLQLFALLAKQPAVQQLRSVEQLGYINELSKRNDYGIRGVQFVIQSTAKDPRHIDSRVEAFLKVFENKIYDMTNEEFKHNVKVLVNTKLEKHKNLWEESSFYWKEISAGTLKFERREHEVEALMQLKQQDFVDFFDEYIKMGAHEKRTMSIRIYGSQHLSDYESDKNEAAQPNSIRIDDVSSFRRSQPLYSSFK